METVEAKPDPNQNTSRSTNIAEVNNSVNTSTLKQAVKYFFTKNRKWRVPSKYANFPKMHKVVFVGFPNVLKTLFVKAGAESSKVIGWTGGPVSCWLFEKPYSQYFYFFLCHNLFLWLFPFYMACRDIRAQGFLIQVQEDLETAVTLPKPKVTFSKTWTISRNWKIFLEENLGMRKNCFAIFVY